MKSILPALLLTAAALSPANAVVLNLNGFSIDAEGSAWNEVTLGGVEIDTTSFLQGFFIDDASLDVGLVSSSASQAVHSGTVREGLDVTITSSILSATANRATFRTELVFTSSAFSGGLNLLSYVDLDLGNSAGADTVVFDGARIVQFEGAIAAYAALSGPGVLGRELAICCGLPDFPLSNNNGPLGPTDVTFSLGSTFDIFPDQSRTFVFDYEFATDFDGLDVPAPAGVALFGLGLAALGLRRRAR